MLTFGSLFAGIGGLDLGLERAGMICKWQVEIDAYCLKVLEKHWPNVKRYGDVRECGRHNLEPVDLICGGFPCQDVSYAGKRKGLKEGTRTGLWYEFARIIREIRPQWVLAENVPGLLSVDSGRGMGTVLRDLAESGYDAEWDCIPAAVFGAPHFRYRVFIVAHTDCRRWPQGTECLRREAGTDSGRGSARTDVADPKSERCREERQHCERPTKRTASSGQILADTQGQRTRTTEQSRSGNGAISGSEDVADSLPERRPWRPSIFQASGTARSSFAEGSNAWGPDKPDVGGVADGLPSRLDSRERVGDCVEDWEYGVPRVARGVSHQTDRLRVIGNAVVPQVAEWIGRRIVAASG